MEAWDNIINTAMIGTDKKQVSAPELPADLQEAAALIQANESIDKEEKFLQITALAFNYRQAGVLASQNQEVVVVSCPPEDNPYCTTLATQVLKDIRSEESIPLLHFWLKQCNAKNQLVPPELIPGLLADGVQHKKLQTLIAACCGKRGEWLGRFNETWNFSQNQTAEQLWQTGAPEQRKAILKDTRSTDPALAATWLQQTWPQEDANTKIAFLEILSTHVSDADIVFLESLATEKSKKVKDEAIRLLKQIPASPVVQLYQQVLKQSVELKKEKALLGLTNKMVLQFQLPESFDDSIFKTGIDKLSNNKAFTDDEFIIFQLIQSVPPTFWESQLGADAKTIIEYFLKDDPGKKMLPALVTATAKFKAAEWALHLMEHSNVFYIELLPLLPLKEQEKYSNQFFDQFADHIIQYAVNSYNEWNISLTKNIFRHIAKNPYHYNRSFFNQNIHLIPAAIVAELEKCAPPDEHLRTMWSNSSDYIMKLVSFKTQTLKAFHA